MTIPSVARRYARALYMEAAGVPRIHEDMELIGETLGASADLTRCLESPVIARERKLSVLEALFASRTDELTMGFVRLVVRGRREAQLHAIATAYRELRDEADGILHAQVRAAAPLESDDIVRLRYTLEERTGKHVVLQPHESDDLLGGIVLRIGDVVYDGSARHHLAQLHTRLSADR